jgi:UDP-N-acetyl-2-amino-2-deoxyglucuronate dehydrogenase
MKRFGIIGVGGFVAPRHLKAISDTGNDLVVAMDTNDSVGVMDSYFPKSEFFTDFEHFRDFVLEEKARGRGLDFMSICSPNHLHFSHIKFALENNINVICEKPLVLYSSDILALQDYEKTSDAVVYTILQLRLHPAILELKKKVESSVEDKVHNVALTYITSRGKWYIRSWKGSEEKSGGVATNIGVHFYDMLQFIFGPVVKNEVHHRDQRTCSGLLHFDRAVVNWFLSIDSDYLPQSAVTANAVTHRSIEIDGEDFEFSKGFTDLHLESYLEILAGRGFGLDENVIAIETVETIRDANITDDSANLHPLMYKIKFDQC